MSVLSLSGKSLAEISHSCSNFLFISVSFPTTRISYSLFVFKYLFIWLCWVSIVARGI